MAEVVEIKNLKFEYLKSNTYSLLYVNGAIGGLTTKGDIMINFYLEYPPTPDVQLFEVANGQMGKEILEKRMPKNLQNGTPTIFRQLQSGVIMNYAEAKGLHQWLGDQIKSLELNIKK